MNLNVVYMAKVRGLQLVIGWFSSAFCGLAGYKQIHCQINGIGGGFKIVRSRPSVWLHPPNAWSGSVTGSDSDSKLERDIVFFSFIEDPRLHRHVWKWLLKKSGLYS